VLLGIMVHDSSAFCHGSNADIFLRQVSYNAYGTCLPLRPDDLGISSGKHSIRTKHTTLAYHCGGAASPTGFSALVIVH